jgi:uncharacterized protein YbjT (DUF2867 family)
VVVFGDAFDVESLTTAFEGVDIVISALGGWGDLVTCHNNVYEACKMNNVKRIVPAQFGFDVLSYPIEEMDEYMKSKRTWNINGINSGIPYTIVSQGAFSQWFLTMPNHPFIHHDTRSIDYCETPDVCGVITSTVEDTARLTVDAVLDPTMANQRISLYGSKLSMRQMAEIFTAITGIEYSLNKVSTFESIERDKLNPQSAAKAFNNYISLNIARDNFVVGFHEPYLVDIEAKYGWKVESFEAAAQRLLPGFLASQGL